MVRRKKECFGQILANLERLRGYSDIPGLMKELVNISLRYYRLDDQKIGHFLDKAKKFGDLQFKLSK